MDFNSISRIFQVLHSDGLQCFGQETRHRAYQADRAVDEGNTEDFMLAR
jgi:hypothetical protein